MGFVAVVEVGGVVGDFIDQVDELGFERRALVEQIFGELGMIRGGVVARMFDDSFADFEGEIQAGKIQVALLEMFDDVQRVQIVIEALAVFAHAQVELLFSGVAEGRMADVVNEREGFGEVGVQAEGAGDGAGDLRDFEGVSEAVAKMVGEAGGEDLRLRFEPAEGARMDDAVAVARVVIAIRMLRFGIAAAARFFARAWRRARAASGSCSDFRTCRAVGSIPGRLAGRSACRDIRT